MEFLRIKDDNPMIIQLYSLVEAVNFEVALVRDFVNLAVEKYKQNGN